MKRVLMQSSPKHLARVATLLLVLGCDGNTPTSPLAGPQPPAPSASIAGRVYSQSRECLNGAVLEVLDGARAGEKSTQNGCATVWNDYGQPAYTIDLPAGKVRVRASMPGYRPKEETFTATTTRSDASNFFLDRE